MMVLVLFLGYPLGNLIVTSFYNVETKSYTLSHYMKTFTDEQLMEVFGNTFKLGFMTVFFCALFAIPAAWGVARTNMPLRKTIQNLVTLTFALPNFLGPSGGSFFLAPNPGN